jgi:hypothetical protein
MSNAISAQHPAVVLRSSYEHLRALLAIAAIVLVGLTVAVVVLAFNTSTTTSAIRAVGVTPVAVRATPSAEAGARLNHSGRREPSLPQGLSANNYLGHR